MASRPPPAATSNDLESIRRFAVAYLRNEQDLDLQAFGVKFDNYYLESSLYADGKVDTAVKTLVDSGKTYEDGRRAVAARPPTTATTRTA